MQITLEQQDVERAIALHLRSMGVTATVDSVRFKAGRKGAGLTAFVELSEDKTYATAEVPCNPEDIQVGWRDDTAVVEDGKVVSEAQESIPEAQEETRDSLFG